MFYVLGNRVQHTLAALGKQEETETLKFRERTTAGKNRSKSEGTDFGIGGNALE
jgi:hypothetical protein